MRDNELSVGATLALCAFIILFGLVVTVTSSYFESQAYNKLTGAQTSTWDAIFLELRVSEGSK